MIRTRAARAACILLAGVLNGWPWLEHTNRESSFVTAPLRRSPNEAPLFLEEFIEPEPSHAMSHVASIAEMRDGRLAASWYAGSREGASDVAIYLSTHVPGDAGWSRPRAIVTRESASHDLNRFVRKVGNGVIFADTGGTLWLLYVTVALGGWSGSSLNVTSSRDDGATWTPSERLTLSPFFNIAELVKNAPAPLSDGGWAVPIYHELVGRMGEVMWLSGAGSHATKSRIDGGRSRYQPALVPLDGARALAVLRDGTGSQGLSVARTDDGGRSWSPSQLVGPPNPDSGLDAIRLTDGRLLLAFNDSATERDNLRLATSVDEGRTWSRVATLAEKAGADFSYPYLIQTSDGHVHVVFSWERHLIRHVDFNQAWLDGRSGGAGP